MAKAPKTEQLQLRVTASQKEAIRRQAERAGLGMSEWILQAVLPSPQRTFQGLVEELAHAETPSLVFAELLDALEAMDADALSGAVAATPQVSLDAYWWNYLAATVELAAHRKGILPPAWTREVAPLPEPVFGSELSSLRLHLLLHAPPPFARRNLFIDASLGDRV